MTQVTKRLLLQQCFLNGFEIGLLDGTHLALDNLAMAARVLNVHIEWLATGRGQRDYIETAPLASVCQDPAEAYLYAQNTLIPPPSRQETLEVSRLFRRLHPAQRDLLLGVLRSLLDHVPESKGI